MKIATWNVNSVRARLEHVTNWLDNDGKDVDVLCLQETKVQDHEFPVMDFVERGYRVYASGQKSYNGVALISREVLHDVEVGFNGVDLGEQKRVISARLGDVHLINVYAPQGESVTSPKFEFKQQFYAELAAWVAAKYSPEQQVLLCGDLNIALDERDVYDVEKFTGRCMFTDAEKAWFGKILDWGMVDSLRLHHAGGEIYSWWDYRAGSWQNNNGMRIDYVLVTKPLAAKCVDVAIHKNERAIEKPSDHVPVVIELK